jgi:hypothetical protein
MGLSYFSAALTKFFVFPYSMQFRHWLTLRDSQIMVKGKGYMQTYWCDPSKNNSNAGGASSHPSHLDDGSEDRDLYDV